MPVAAASPLPTRSRLGRALTALCGGVWGVGLARVLAHELRVTLCTWWSGVALVAILGAALALGFDRRLVRRRHDLARAAPWALPLLLPLIDLLGASHQPWRGPALVVGAWLAVILGLTHAARRRWFALALLIPLLVYLPDISPYVGRADTFEFQVVGPQLGIAHPSGYPLYTLICKLFSLLPFGTVAWRVNLSSAVFAALGAGFLFLALDTLASRPGAWPVAFLSAMMMAFSPTLWSRAIEAEVYALNACLVAVGLWLAVRWHRGSLAPDRAWPAFGALLGLALASHVTLGALGLLVVPGLLSRRLRPPWRAWGLALVLGLAGVALYAYIPLRWPAVTDGTRMSWSAFLRFVTNAGSGGALRPLAFIQDPGRWALVGDRFLAQIGWAGVGLAMFGVGGLAVQSPVLASGTVLAFLAWVWFSLGFYVADPDYSAFLIPAHIVLITWLGVGAQVFYRALARITGHLSPSSKMGGERRANLSASGLARPAQVTVTAMLAALVLSRLWVTGPTLDTASQGRGDELWARYVLQQPLLEGAAVLADSEKFPPLYYLQQVVGLRSDLELVTLFSEAQYRAELESRLAAGQPVYLARYLPGMDAFGVASVGPLVAVGPAAGLDDAVSADDGTLFGDALVLDGYELAADPLGRARHHLTLSWSVTAAIESDLEVRLRLVHPIDGQVVWEGDAARPVSGYTTTQAWQIGWHVEDYHALVWPRWIPAGAYALELGVFPRFGAEGLPVAGAAGVWHTLAEIAVPAPRDAQVSPGTMAQYGAALWLLDADVPADVAAGGVIPLDLTWDCTRSTDVPSVMEVRWTAQDAGGQHRTLLNAVGQPAPLAFCRMPSPAPVTRRYLVAAPSQPGQYALALSGRVADEAGTAAARCRWLGAERSACPLAEVTLSAADEGLANFGDRILLLEARFDAAAVPAGGPLSVDLVWRARQALQKNYTVFVQVIGPDGRLYGQVDTWPVQGTHPTTAWTAGETVEDPYRLYLDPDTPAGTYRIIVGWYLLADMTRLPVVAADGRQMGDFFEVGTFKLP